MRVIDLFSGIGGFSLGLERAGMETVAFCEIDPFCQKVLKKHWPDVPIFEDIKTLKGDEVGAVDLVCGGFPCQPFSCARHGVPSKVEDFSGDTLRIIKESMPRYAVVENVQRRVIGWVANGLRNIGYRAITRCYSVEQFGGWHQRNRWFAIAYPNDKSEFQGRFDAEMAFMQSMGCNFRGKLNPSRALRVDDGVPHRVERLRMLGNSVSPLVTEAIGSCIVKNDTEV